MSRRRLGIGRDRQAKLKVFSALEVRNFRVFISGQAVSLTGTWMQSVAIALLVLKLTDSGADLGAVVATQYLPILLFGPLGGSVADRVRKRRLLLCTQSALAMLSLALGTLVATGAIQMWMVFLTAACTGIVNTFDQPTRQTFIYQMVGPETLPAAISMNSMLANLSRVIGPALAALFVSVAGLSLCFFYNGMSFVASLMALSLIDPNQLWPETVVTRRQARLRGLLGYLRHDPDLLMALMAVAVIGTFSFEYQVSLPLLAEHTFHGTASKTSWLVSALGGGGIFGGVVAVKLGKVTTKDMSFLTFALGVVTILASLAPTYPLAVTGVVCVGVANVAFIASNQTFTQLQSDPSKRGRVLALRNMGWIGSTALGGPIVGIVGDNFGARFGLGIGGVAACAVGIILAATVRGRAVAKDRAASFREADVVMEPEELAQ